MRNIITDQSQEKFSWRNNTKIKDRPDGEYFAKKSKDFYPLLGQNINDEENHEMRFTYSNYPGKKYQKENNLNTRSCERRPEQSKNNKNEIYQNDLQLIKNNILEIKNELKNANLANLKNEISEIKQMNQENEEIKNEVLILKEEIIGIKNLINELINNKETPKNEINNTEEDAVIIEKEEEKKNKIIPDRKIIIWMNRKNHIIKVHDKYTLEDFINKCKNSFKLGNFDNIIIHYFNKFGNKYIIKNKEDFQKSLENKVSKYYLTENKLQYKTLNCEYFSKNDIEKSKNLSKNVSNLDKYLENFKNLNSAIIKNNNELNEDDFSDKIYHLASLAQNEIEEKIEYFLNSADYISEFMLLYNSKKKEKSPNYFINTKEMLKKPGLLSKGKKDKNDFDFILSLLAELLKGKKIDISIFKNEGEEDHKKDKLYDASVQYLFCGLFIKKKIEINFKLEAEEIDLLNKKEDELSEFIDVWKTKISHQLKIDEKEISFINPKKKGNESFSLDLISNDDSIFKDIKKLSDFNEINYYHEKSFIEACQLNNNIFEPHYNNEDGGWGFFETRGGEKYIPPIGWKGYALNVKGKYDFGNDTWLDYKDREGVFAVAYLGISYFNGNEEKYLKYLTEVNTPEILKMNNEQIYKNDYDLRNPKKKCGCGVYLFQDPKIAENTAGIIDIYGVRYKVLLMCRVNPKKIRQPKGFEECWILNPSPDEIRPYRILVKTIFKSPLAEASQQGFKIFYEPSLYYQEIMETKDISFYKTNNSENDNDYYVINKYTSNDYVYINEYLRTGKVPEGIYTERQIKSWVWCLHDALTNKKSNVPNSSVYFRGLALHFSEELEIGSKFILGEFISVSKSLNIALLYSGMQTLFIIRIENNQIPPGYYCYDIEEMSVFNSEKEILITSNCSFQLTKKEKKSIKNLKEELKINEKITDMNENEEIFMVYLTCLGNFYDVKNTISFS